MKLNFTASVYIILLFVSFGYSQNTDDLKAINTQIWANFTKAFETLDANLFENLHSETLIRASGDNKSIRDKAKYIDGYKNRWKNNTINQTISFRFLERFCDNNTASERGIYKLTRNPNTDEDKSYYGKFHVYLKKENNSWKILIDYDSTENNTINEVSYNNAFAIDDFNKYKQ